VIVMRNAFETRQNADGFGRFLPAGRMGRIVGQRTAAGTVQPLTATADVEATLVKVHHMALDQRFLHSLHHRLQPSGRPSYEVL